VKCRYDWHQTASTVTVAIYCKRYDPAASSVEVGPVRLKVTVDLPELGGAYNMDAELKGIVLPEKAKVTMFGTKMEIVLAKAEAGGWSRLGSEVKAEPLPPSKPSKTQDVVVLEPPKAAKEASEQPASANTNEDFLGLDNLELSSNLFTLSEAAGGRGKVQL